MFFVLLFGSLEVLASPAWSGDVGGNSGGYSDCSGLGYLGPAIGVGGQCVGQNPPPAPSTHTPGGHAIETGPTGYYWMPGSGDSLSYENCPNGKVPQYVQEYNPQGGPVGLAQMWCPGEPLPTPAPPAPPPGPAEVWAEVPLPTAVVRFSPERDGLTQLPTWFWAQGVSESVDVTAEIGGYLIATRAQPVAYTWEFGDGTSATVPSAGSASDPSVGHTYTEAGTYDVSLVIEYAGSFNFVGPTGNTGTEPLSPYYSAPFVESYTVQQVRSVLVPTGEG
jgi:PKD domain